MLDLIPWTQSLHTKVITRTFDIVFGVLSRDMPNERIFLLHDPSSLVL